MGEFLLWAAAEFAVSGYIINKIQKEKETENFSATETLEYLRNNTFKHFE